MVDSKNLNLIDIVGSLDDAQNVSDLGGEEKYQITEYPKQKQILKK